MGGPDRRAEREFDVLARMTARLASTASMEELCDAVVDEIAALGFGGVWVASYDEAVSQLRTLRCSSEGKNAADAIPDEFLLDERTMIHRAFVERKLLNFREPRELHILEDESEDFPAGTAIPRAIFDQVQRRPFACGPVLGSRGQPVGAVGLSSYRGGEPIPDEMLAGGLLRALVDHLGIGIERSLYVERLERLNAELVRVREAIERDARVKAVGELAATVAHDLNNLSSIALMAVSVGSRSPSAATDVLPRLEKACLAIGDLVTRLQRVARPSNESALQAPVDLAQIAEDVALMVTPMCREESIALELDIDERPRVVGEPGVLDQILTNLLVNAREALREVPEDRRNLRVSVSRDGKGALLIVEDSGPGVPEHLLGNIFEPFFTSKASNHPGLGLATIRSAVCQMAGEVRAENRSEGGARFQVRIPTAEDEDDGGAGGDDDERSAAGREGQPTLSARAGGDATRAAKTRDASAEPFSVLIVEDDLDVVDILREYFEPLGHRVARARHAREALAAADETDFDIVLCDLGIPGRTGTEVLAELRRRGSRALLVLTTGWHSRLVPRGPGEAGPDAVLSKPFTAEAIRGLLDRLTRHRAPAD